MNGKNIKEMISKHALLGTTLILLMFMVRHFVINPGTKFTGILTLSLMLSLQLSTDYIKTPLANKVMTITGHVLAIALFIYILFFIDFLFWL